MAVTGRPPLRRNGHVADKNDRAGFAEVEHSERGARRTRFASSDIEGCPPSMSKTGEMLTEGCRVIWGGGVVEGESTRARPQGGESRGSIAADISKRHYVIAV